MTTNDLLTTTSTILTPLSDRSGVSDPVRAQILATEHWSLLATRSMTWNEVFSRASMFVTVLSAAVVVLALVAQATAFGPGFRLFALLRHAPKRQIGEAPGRWEAQRQESRSGSQVRDAVTLDSRFPYTSYGGGSVLRLAAGGRICGAEARSSRNLTTRSMST